jgi:hypothetical protein
LLAYTPTISAIVTVVKMLVLYRLAVKQKKHVVKIIKKKEFAKDNAKNLALSYFNLLKKIANKFITLTYYSSTLSLIN